MPSWNQLLAEIHPAGKTHDVLRKEHLANLRKGTGRNAIVYYSGWLQKPHLRGVNAIRWDINDADKEAFMAVIHRMDRTLGLDLFLHALGGEVAATESLMDYLRAMFTDIRAVIPQLAMSGGTMIACSCDQILMGKQSSLGPIDPQIGNGMPAHGVLEEFKRAQKEIAADPSRIAVWQPIIAKYSPTLNGECEKALKWASEIAREPADQTHVSRSARCPQGCNKSGAGARGSGSDQVPRSSYFHRSRQGDRFEDRDPRGRSSAARSARWNRFVEGFRRYFLKVTSVVTLIGGVALAISHIRGKSSAAISAMPSPA
jgi:hypothetical protein